MTKLEQTIERLRALPEGDKDGVAAQIDLLLDGDDLLTPEQWADIEARLDQNETMVPHEEVASAFRNRTR